MHESNDTYEGKSWLYHLIRQYGEPPTVMKTNDYTCYRQAIANNTGIGFYTLNHARQLNLFEADDVVVLNLRGKVVLYHYGVYIAEKLSLPAKAFLELMTN